MICHFMFFTLLAFSSAQYRWTTKYFTQQVDHFSFTSTETYSMKYLYNDSYWDSKGGPILFYCGNEGAIEGFATNTGLMWDLAPKLKAMILFAEHRYYGDSLPFGKDAFKDASKTGYLTSEQALADYAVFLKAFKAERSAEASPVIAFGGSYGGMLAAWMRAKYPQSVQGALAASAPVWQFQDVTPCNAYSRIVTKTFARYGDECVENIRRSWSAIDAMFNSGAEGQKFLLQNFNICGSMKTKDDLNNLKAWINGAWSNIAMVEYPYPASFLQPLPAWPIKEVCKYLGAAYWQIPKIQLRQLAQSLNVYYNYTGEYPGSCYNTTAEPDNLGADQGWNFQACTEMIMPMCSDNKNDMFEAAIWNLTQTVQDCAKQYGVTPQPYWILTNYLGKTLSGVSNIIFSNGLLDPWHGGGILSSIPEQNITALTIPDGAHHLDLRAANPADPADVQAVRDVEVQIIKQWIANAGYHGLSYP